MSTCINYLSTIANGNQTQQTQSAMIERIKFRDRYILYEIRIYLLDNQQSCLWNSDIGTYGYLRLRSSFASSDSRFSMGQTSNKLIWRDGKGDLANLFIRSQL
jgi:hypothetical protein